MRIWSRILMSMLMSFVILSFGCTKDDRLMLRYMANPESIKVQFDPPGERMGTGVRKYKLSVGSTLMLKVNNVGLRDTPDLTISYVCEDESGRSMRSNVCNPDDYVDFDRNLFYEDREQIVIGAKKKPLLGYRISFLVVDLSLQPHSASGFYVFIE